MSQLVHNEAWFGWSEDDELDNELLPTDEGNSDDDPLPLPEKTIVGNARDDDPYNGQDTTNALPLPVMTWGG